MPRHLLLIGLAAFAFTACGSAETGPPLESATAEEPGPEATAAEEPTEPEEAEPRRGATVTVTRLSGTDTAPATGRPGTLATATVSVEGAAVVLGLETFVTYCAPAPEFTARLEEDTLVVQAVRPDAPTRCIGPHSVRLQLDGVPAGERAVSVRNTEGEEVATARVVVGAP